MPWEIQERSQTRHEGCDKVDNPSRDARYFGECLEELLLTDKAVDPLHIKSEQGPLAWGWTSSCRVDRIWIFQELAELSQPSQVLPTNDVLERSGSTCPLDTKLGCWKQPVLGADFLKPIGNNLLE